MTFIDTHCHISDEAFAGEEDAYIRRAREAGVEIMLQPDVDSREREAMFSLTDRHPGVLYPMLGLYPGSVDKDWKKEIDRMLEYSGKKVVAIGEIGLDYYYGKEFAAEQKEALHWQLDYAKERDLPVNVHLRDAMGDFLDILRSHKGLRGNMHAYSGSYESFLELQRLGDWSVGVGGVVTFKKASLAEVVKKVPLERIVLETDAPYLTPVPFRGRRNESSHIPLIAAKVAELKGLPVEEVAAVTTSNARNLFGI
ncbi:MAG: TatD family hydrolase [Bacteroidales bacterium]|nr:TatD family hydrolase [Bacteroidales bacterium]MBP3270310.1 TatD family hydrolase [Bacteroidales bacterium]